MVSAENIHAFLLGLPRYDFSSYKQLPFSDGIYVMFENGESFNGHERITRIGTHDKDGRLLKRLTQHIAASESSKNGSVFLKNVGMAMLAENKDPYIDVFSKSRKSIKNDSTLIYDEEKEVETAKRSAEYIRENISFVCIPAKTRETRNRIEGCLISSLRHDSMFRSSISDNWLGKYSPKREIRESGLWVSQKLNFEELTEDEFQWIKDSCLATYSN